MFKLVARIKNVKTFYSIALITLKFPIKLF